MNNLINWKEIIDGDQWFAAYAQVEEDLRDLSWLQRNGAKLAWAGAMPEYVRREIASISKFLGVDRNVVTATQVIYDEAWNLDTDVPLRGCTSVSENGAFGRNLDYGYPHNAKDLVFHSEIEVGDRTCRIEGFAGLLGFLAIANDDAAVAINQAPKLRPLRRGRLPGLLWFRREATTIMKDAVDFTDAGRTKLPDPPASDLLMHYVIGNKSYLAEVHDQTLVWQHIPGKVIQTNAYQLFDATASEDWEADSRRRSNAARSGRTLKQSLKKASVNDWTIDTFIK